MHVLCVFVHIIVDAFVQGFPSVDVRMCLYMFAHVSCANVCILRCEKYLHMGCVFMCICIYLHICAFLFVQYVYILYVSV